MIVVTGAAGFIGSCMISQLNNENFNRIIAVDHFDDENKIKNLANKTILQLVDRDDFFSWVDKNAEDVEFIFHLGARTDTATLDRTLLWKLNTDYSKNIWKKCCDYQIPLVYASSAATYGLGEFGYEDQEDIVELLRPLNPYGESKNAFDLWAIQQKKKPFYWAGLKFFNVYGPNEYHKGRMASVVLHAYNQIKEDGKMRLFRSHNSLYRDGEQKRDFIYVKDVIKVMYWLMHHRRDSGLYNLGSGTARTFKDLTRIVFNVMEKKESIEYIETPPDIRENYQYFTEAKMGKLRSIGYTNTFFSLEEGIEDYVTNYLSKKSIT